MIQGAQSPFARRRSTVGTAPHSRGRLCSPPRRAGLAPRDTAEQAAPDRPVHQADVALRAWLTSNQACCRTQGRSPRGVGSSPTWPLTRFPSFHSFIAEPATVAGVARPSRRAGPCPRRRLWAAPSPCACFLDGQSPPARMFAGDELRKDGGNGDRPGSLRRTHRSQHRALNLGIRLALETTGSR